MHPIYVRADLTTGNVRVTGWRLYSTKKLSFRGGNSPEIRIGSLAASEIFMMRFQNRSCLPKIFIYCISTLTFLVTIRSLEPIHPFIGWWVALIYTLCFTGEAQNGRGPQLSMTSEGERLYGGNPGSWPNQRFNR